MNLRAAQHAVELDTYFLRMKKIGYGYEQARDLLEDARAIWRGSAFEALHSRQVIDAQAMQDVWQRAIRA